MSANSGSVEIAQLQARIAVLEEQLQAQKAESKKTPNLEAREVEALREQAEYLELSEQALHRLTDMYQAVLRSMSPGVVVADQNGRFLLFNDAAERILGIGPLDITPSEWSANYGCYLLDRVTPYPSEQLPLARAIRGEHVDDAEVFIRNPRRPAGVYLSISARPLRDGGGTINGGLCVYRDITEKKRTERRLAAEHSVTRVLAEAATLEEATPRILQAICDSVGWEAGALWRVERNTKIMHCVDLWHRLDAGFAELEALTRKISYSPGVGLPGIVWVSGKPIWVEDILVQPNFPRAEIAARAGLRAAFAFPILFGSEVTGVIEFSSREFEKPDEELLSILTALGRQIGQFIARRRAEKDLRRSRERFELAMQGSGDGLWDWDIETDEVYYSPRWKSTLGHEDHEIANNFGEWEKRLHPDDRRRAMATIRNYFEGRTDSYELEHRLRHKDGTYRWILARGVALRDANGRPYRMAGSHTDITQRKEAEQMLRDSEALYQSLVETLPLNIIRKDLDGRFTFCNKLFCNTIGQPLEQLVGKTDFDFYPRHLAEKYRQDDRRVVETREVLDLIEEHQQPDGKRIYVQVIKTPVYDAAGGVIGIQLIFWDVTDRKTAEEAMQRAKDAAESANRAKSVFLANMSHEIRTPMNAIIGMTELVLETPLTIEQREYLDLVKKSADSLLSVINDVLDFSKVEAGRLDLDQVDFNLRDTLGDVLNTLAPRAHQKRIELACHVSVDAPDGVVGDPVRLGQIIMNLVGNAIKFTERGEVVVDVEATSRSEDEIWLHFAVSDTGIGVPSDKLDMIFEAFAQADGSTTRKYGGTGLGLAIVKRLIERMGGRIWVASEVGRGSTFHFTARFGLQKGRVAKTAPIDDMSMSGMAVLVVDDNATNRRILEETLTHWQMQPTVVSSGSEALEALQLAAEAGEPFRIALIDVQMPVMDGYTLCQHIRRDPHLAGTILMILTSGGQPGDHVRRRELNVAACLIKPVKQADLWRAIMQSLGMPLPVELSELHARERVSADRQLRVLLAEDNLVNQKLAVRLLEKRGHEVTIANNGQEALDLLATASFDVVLMDVQMPQMDGYETTERIRQQEQLTGRHIRIVAMTAYAMKGDRDRCLEVGMDSYISKPIRARELFESIESATNGGLTHASADLAGESGHGVFDRNIALLRVGNDLDLLRELGEVFLRECPKLLDEIRAAIAAENVTLLKTTAHGLKGSIDNFAAQSAFEAALMLEDMGREGKIVGARDALGVLEREVAQLRQALLEFTAEKIEG